MRNLEESFEFKPLDKEQYGIIGETEVEQYFDHYKKINKIIE